MLRHVSIYKLQNFKDLQDTVASSTWTCLVCHLANRKISRICHVCCMCTATVHKRCNESSGTFSKKKKQNHFEPAHGTPEPNLEYYWGDLDGPFGTLALPLQFPTAWFPFFQICNASSFRWFSATIDYIHIVRFWIKFVSCPIHHRESGRALPLLSKQAGQRVICTSGEVSGRRNALPDSPVHSILTVYSIC